MCQDKCVFCQSNDCQRKVLRCLHVACKPCIVEHLSGKNTITCVRCHKDTPGPALYQSCSQLTSPRLMIGLVVCFPSDLYYNGDVIVINIIVVVLFRLVRP